MSLIDYFTYLWIIFSPILMFHMLIIRILITRQTWTTASHRLNLYHFIGTKQVLKCLNNQIPNMKQWPSSDVTAPSPLTGSSLLAPTSPSLCTRSWSGDTKTRLISSVTWQPSITCHRGWSISRAILWWMVKCCGLRTLKKGGEKIRWDDDWYL